MEGLVVARAKCVVTGCPDAAASRAPVDLCPHHIALVVEWAGESASTDLLPSRCAACGGSWGVRLPSGWLCAVCEWRYGDVVDDELPRPRVDVVYYLRYADRVKIGTTVEPRRRFAAIRHDELLGLERGGRALERERHAQFDDERFERTEWFALSERLGAHIARIAAGEPVWHRHARWVSEALACRA